VRYEALPGLWIPAILYLPEKISGPTPVHLAVNGHDPLGKAAPYKQIRCINLAQRGVISLNVEWFAMGQLRTDGFQHYRMNQLDLCGTSGIAPFYLAMKRGLDLLLALEHADASRVAVSGLSGGGWQTIFISSLDERVTLADPVAGYSSFRTRARFLSDLGDSEQTPCDLATVADYTHLTAMRAPRPTLLTFNAKDNCCFAADHALQPLLDAAQPVFAACGVPERLRAHVNHDPGTHNFERDNREALYRMIGDFFFPGDTSFKRAESPCENEVKTAGELRVELPADNLDFHQMALSLAGKLPRDPQLAGRNPKSARQKLRAIVRPREYAVTANVAGPEEQDGVKVKFLKLQLGQDWTVPLVELTPGEPKGTVLLIADGGRRSVAAEAGQSLAAGQRVLVADLFYFGESKIAQRDFLFALLVAAVGERPLGLQAGQLLSLARWATVNYHAGPVTVMAVGPRTSLIALVAGALEEKTIGALELRNPLPSLKDVIEKNGSVDKTPELFCFGLLEAFDIPQLETLFAPRVITHR